MATNPSIATVEIAEMYRICVRAVFDVHCLSHDFIEVLMDKLCIVHSTGCRLDIKGLLIAPAQPFCEEVARIMNYTGTSSYAGPPLKFAEAPMLLDTSETATEPAQYLEQADRHPWVQHGQHPTWQRRAAEGCMQVLLSTPETGHTMRGIDDYECKADIMRKVIDVIREAHKQGGGL